MQCFSIEGNRMWLDGGAMFGNAPKAMWSRWAECDEHNRVPLACRSLLVKAGGPVLLFEAGIGSFMEPKRASRYGAENRGSPLLRNLEAAGVREEEVDYVILSHLHFDHAGGLIPDWPAISTPDWAPHFPKAKYVVSRAQWERARSPHLRDRASYVPELYAKLESSGRLLLTDAETTGLPGLEDRVSFIYASGHTPGLMHAIIRGEKRTVFFTSDTIPGTAWIHLPIVMGYDRFAEQTVDGKMSILETAVAEGWLLFYTHDPEVVASSVKIGDRDRYEACDSITGMTGERV